jgi:CheY-like chemotaxis protein
MQAITWLAKNKCDLILLDYKMPIVSGAEVYRMLQSEPATKDIPVMFLTGKNDRNTISEVLSLKPQKYILKSIGHEELLATLANFFA